MTKIIITGAKGRMGKALIACAPNFRELEIAAQIDLGDDLNSFIARGDVVIDFSSHTATAGIAEICAKHQKALVIGTTPSPRNEAPRRPRAAMRIPPLRSSRPPDQCQSPSCSGWAR